MPGIPEEIFSDIGQKFGIGQLGKFRATRLHCRSLAWAWPRCQSIHILKEASVTRRLYLVSQYEQRILRVTGQVQGESGNNILRA